MSHTTPYTTQLGAGLGMVPETVDLLRLWEPGMSAASLSARVIQDGLFARTTARRARNLVVEMFAPRYLVGGGAPAARLKFLAEHRFPHESLVQLFFLHTARAQQILADFVIHVYWPKYSAGANQLTRDDAQEFVHRGLDSGRMARRWASSTIKRVSGYLLGCCKDFGLLARGTRSSYQIQRFSMRPEVALYLAHDLHDAGLSDMALVQSSDWQLFGFEPGEVIARLKSLANDGHLLIQSSGELHQISWKYKSMEDCLHALTQR